MTDLDNRIRTALSADDEAFLNSLEKERGLFAQIGESFRGPMRFMTIVANVAVLMGDWTRPDPGISRFLEKHGRAGVPLYIYYAPGAEPVVLPQILTVATLTDLVNGSVQSAMADKSL